MSFDKPVRCVAVVGTGVIGASWAAQYLARGLDVVATDPAANAAANLRNYVDEAWEQLEEIGLSPGASRDRLSFTKDSKQALAKADFVQENGPERPDFKIKLFADMDEATPVDSIIASSSSGITPSVMQSACKHPERVIVGHPFNPPALYREVLHLIEQGVLSVEETDTAVSCGPGLRWGVMGQSLQWHLGGGAGGIKHFMEQLMDPLAAMMKTLGNPQVTPELKQTIVDGVMREAGGRSVDELAREENEVIIGLLRLRANGASASLAEKEADRAGATI
jgi:3-hydroxyacyl-CoA dehydrogenase